VRLSTNVPKVVITDRPIVVHCRDEREAEAAEALLDVIRRRGDPIAIVYRRRGSREVEVLARSSSFSSARDVTDVMQEAAAKLVASFLGRSARAR
jgi:hypothetical protein